MDCIQGVWKGGCVELTEGALWPVTGGCGKLSNQRLAWSLPDALAHPIKYLACDAQAVPLCISLIY